MKLESQSMQIPVDGISVNKEVDVAVDLTSPAVPCLVGIFHIGDWRHLLVKCLDNEFGFILRSVIDTNYFFHCGTFILCVLLYNCPSLLIQMVISQPNSATGGLNPDLNLPPENTSRGWLGTIDAEPFHNVAPKPISSNTSGELVKPFVNQIPNRWLSSSYH